MIPTYGTTQLIHATVWSPLRASLGRTTLSIVAIALGVALGFAIYTMNRAATLEVSLATRSLFGEADLVVQGTQQGFDEALYPIIARIPGVAVASPIVEVNARVPGKTARLSLIGIDLLREARLHVPAVADSRTSDERGREGLWFFDADNVLLSAQAAQALQLKVDDVLTVQVGVRAVSFHIKGVLPADAYHSNVGVMDIAAAQWRLDQLGRLSRIHLRLAPGANPTSVAAAIARVLPPQVKVTTPAAVTQQSRQLSRAFTTNLTALALVALFTGGFLVYSTQSLNVMRRRREFALLHALGVTRRQQIGSVVFTGATLGAVGAMLGVALGALLAGIGLNLIMISVGAAEQAPELHFTALEVCAFVLLGLIVSIAGSLVPALNAAAIPTAQALKAGDVDQGDMRGHAYWGVLLWILAPMILTLPTLFDLPYPGYVAIACILLGAVLLIPAFTRGVLALLPSRGSASYQTAIAQLRGAAHTATVSIATILVSVSLMVAMAIMTTSLRSSYADSINRMLPADVYVAADRNSSAAYLDAATVRTLQSVPGVQRTASTRMVEILLDKNRPPITVVARPIDVKNPGAALSLEAQASRPPPTGTVPIWISVSLADHYGLGPDDQLTLNLGGRDVAGSIRGIWRDNGRPTDALTLDIRHYRQLTRDTHTTSLGLWLSPGYALEQVMQSIRAQLPAAIDVEVGLPSEIRARQLRGFDRIFAITYLLLAVAVLIGLFGISVSASAQALARRAEFGVLRHLGFTRRQIGRLLAIEGLSLGALGVLGSLLVGGVISLVLIHVVGRQSFHWSMELHVPYFSLFALTCVVPLAAAGTALWSGRSAMSADVVRAVKEDW
jgi:putative ABC transport system permease protein